MRYIIFIFFLMVAGCSKKPVDPALLIEKNGVTYYGKDSNMRYTGEASKSYFSERRYIGKYEAQYKNGLLLDSYYLLNDGTRIEHTNHQTLFEKDGLKYLRNSDIPYTGKIINKRKNGSIFIGECKDGKLNGQGTYKWADGHKYVGEWKDNLPNGQGTWTWADGNKYVGEWKDGENHGQGTYTWADGKKYVGEWKDDKKHGQGTFTWADGKKYVGEYRDGKRNGQGTYTWPGGEKYVGEYRDGKYHGQGTWTHPDGHKYVGEWKDNLPNGQGTWTWADGKKYVGEWKDGENHGQGTFTWADGKKYVGEFRDGKRNGQGTYTWADGKKYVGEFRDDKRLGQGTWTHPDGEKYVGEYRDDKKNGQGTYTWPGGEKYVGEWKDDKKHGQGTFTWADGKKYVGEFRDDKRNGQGTYTWADGKKYVGEWKDDKRHGYGMERAGIDYYVGEWKDGMKHGQGIERKPIGSGGIWSEGELIEHVAYGIVNQYLLSTYPGYPTTEEKMIEYLAKKKLPKYPQPKLPPNLSMDITFIEPSGNDFLDAEEEGEIQFKVMNNGKGEAYGLTMNIDLIEEVIGLSFQGADKDILVDQINPGDFEMITQKVSANENISTGTISFEISISEFNGFDLYPKGKLVMETKALVPPDLQLVDIGIDDLNNYNGRIDPNEVVDAKAIIQNRGQGIAKGVQVVVTYGESVFPAGEPKNTFSFGDMFPNDTKEIDFSFFANRKASTDLPIEIEIKEQRGKYDKTLPLGLSMDRSIKKANEVFIKGKEDLLVNIIDNRLISIDIEENIPVTKTLNNDGIAVVIGNREYSNNMPLVDFSVRDAEYMKEYLIKTLGYRKGNIFYYPNTTLADMKVAFNKLKNAVRKNRSDVFVYYSGHGAPDPNSKQGYFVPVDADPNFIQETGYAVDDLYDILNQTGAKSTTVIIDACFSGSSYGGLILKDISPVFIKVHDSNLDLKNSVVLTSATGEQISTWYRDKKHSLFTYYFLKGLQGEADLDSDGRLIVSELKSYIDDNVPYMARKLSNMIQEPQLMTDDGSRVLVAY